MLAPTDGPLVRPPHPPALPLRLMPSEEPVPGRESITRRLKLISVSRCRRTARTTAAQSSDAADYAATHTHYRTMPLVLELLPMPPCPAACSQHPPAPDSFPTSGASHRQSNTNGWRKKNLDLAKILLERWQRLLQN